MVGATAPVMVTPIPVVFSAARQQLDGLVVDQAGHGSAATAGLLRASGVLPGVLEPDALNRMRLRQVVQAV